MAKKRIFIGIKIHPGEKFFQLWNRLKLEFNDDKIYWEDFEKTHLTLKFIGDTDVLIIPKIISELKMLIPKIHVFHFEIEGCGIFGGQEKPRVIWFGTKKDEQLIMLVQQIETVLENIGIIKETRDFKPHVTLGKIQLIRDSSKFIKIIENVSGTQIQKQEVSEIILYESILTKKGSVYEILEKFEL